MVRKAQREDIDKAMQIYHYAQDTMIRNGNPGQWGHMYPTPEILEEDIVRERLYVIERNGVIAGVFMFEIGEDATYRKIDGKWLDDGEYGVIHRIAGNGKEKGILHEAAEFAFSRIGSVRIDTHERNTAMRNAIRKEGFSFCGIISTYDGTGRLAFQKLRQ